MNKFAMPIIVILGLSAVACDIAPVGHDHKVMAQGQRGHADDHSADRDMGNQNQRPVDDNGAARGDALDQALQSFLMLASVEETSAADMPEANEQVANGSNGAMDHDHIDGHDGQSHDHAEQIADGYNARPHPGLGWGVILRRIFMFSEEMQKLILERFDQDKNGKISKEELLAIFVRKMDRAVGVVHAFAQAKCNDEPKDGREIKSMSLCGRVHTKADANKDGEVSDEEMKAFEAERMKRFAEKQNRMILRIADLFCGSNAGLCEDKLLEEIKARDEKKFHCELPPPRPQPIPMPMPMPTKPSDPPPPKAGQNAPSEPVGSNKNL